MDTAYRTRVAGVIALTLLVGACAAPPLAPVSDLSKPLAEPRVIRIVRPGDSLYSISWAAGVDWRQLAYWNGIMEPYVIRPGQRLSLVPTGRPPPSKPRPSGVTVTPVPVEGGVERQQTAPVAIRPATAPQTANASAPPAHAASPPVSALPSAATGGASAPGKAPAGWRWPVRGKVVSGFAATKGYDIAVPSGSQVRAAAGGRVVYAGSGLRGYGQLIIVKHSDEYLSAYGHNRKLLVREGDQVADGQVIAESGSAPGQGERLHFEIRRNGNPVDPAGYLPAASS